MLLLLLGLLFAVPILWTVSVGAVREARRARRRDPREGCQAWVAVRGLRDRRYRCGEPVYAGGRWCLRHEPARAGATHDEPEDAELIDAPQAAGRALVLARIGVPIAVAASLGAIAALVWAIQRAI